MMTGQNKLKVMQNILHHVNPHWVGDGFNVSHFWQHGIHQWGFTIFDVWLCCTEVIRANHQERCVGLHPHHSMEMVTIALQGEVEHHDSLGNASVIHPGEVQWMTASHGIITNSKLRLAWHNEHTIAQHSRNGTARTVAQIAWAVHWQWQWTVTVTSYPNALEIVVDVTWTRMQLSPLCWYKFTVAIPDGEGLCKTVQKHCMTLLVPR